MFDIKIGLCFKKGGSDQLKFVAVSQRVDYFKGRNEVRDSIDMNLSNFLLTNGLCPIMISNNLICHNVLEKVLCSFNIGGIVLSGGNSIGEFKERDDTELFLLNFAEKRQLPLLGICRGMQIMAIREGVNLKSIVGHVKSKHQITGEINGVVNSFHNFSIEECPDNYNVSALSEDGCIEAIKHKTLSWEGWMWHPERESPFNKSDNDRLKKIFCD